MRAHFARRFLHLSLALLIGLFAAAPVDAATKPVDAAPKSATKNASAPKATAPKAAATKAKSAAPKVAPKPAPIVQASIVIDADTGRVLHEDDADTITYPASLTKMMTLYLAFDALKAGKITLDTPLVISKHAIAQPPTKMFLRLKDHMTVEQGILALVIRSANDVAAAMAETLAPTEEEFALKMTAKARKLGMTNTTFRNASGLPNQGQITTARDMAKLGRALLRDHPGYYAYFARDEFTYRGEVIRTHNRLLASYEGTDGIKTGYINASGFNLVSSAKRDGRRLVGVVLGGRTAHARDLHMQQLLTASFDRAGSNSELLVAEKRSPAPAAKQTVAVATPVRAPAPTLAPLPEVETVVVSLDAKEMPAITREWAIQIGAFGASKTAMGAAQQAVTTAAAFLDDGEVKVVPLKMRDGKTLHRGRIIGLTKDQAEGACKVLKKAQSTCMELRLKDDSVQTAATSR